MMIKLKNNNNNNNNNIMNKMMNLFYIVQIQN